MAELTIKVPQLERRHVIVMASGGATAIILATIAIIYLSRTTGLAAIAPHIDSFTPYYFRHQPPDTYSVDQSHSTYSNGILQITLKKPGGSSVVLTEQSIPASLNTSALLTTGTQIHDAAGPAIVTTVEDRVVGTMLPSGHKTLILINAPASIPTGDVTDLLKSLQPPR